MLADSRKPIGDVSLIIRFAKRITLMDEIFAGRNFRVEFNFANFFHEILFRENLISRIRSWKKFRVNLISRMCPFEGFWTLDINFQVFKAFQLIHYNGHPRIVPGGKLPGSPAKEEMQPNSTGANPTFSAPIST